MADPYLGEIRMFAGNFAPQGWALCQGQLLLISQADALFSLFGTIYGGDGQTTFALPDLRGRIPLHQGQGPSLSNRIIGQKSGLESVAVSAAQLPPHGHQVQVSTANAASVDPAGKQLGNAAEALYRSSGGSLVTMNTSSIASSTGGQQHANIQPYLCVNFIVALAGLYPSRP